ncbi:hypothetical protein [Ancylobacter pratisalsi]|uniref:Uncharacterized protein n=1 Tax=Ancylobacter pratisalsi TaxID=1745854 RepID=A0A6P1YGJ5_9HYPH|nr:hypothetical protein [Ancylobacter pratisalsi]QIB32272.1 hypothetical protein G3A50_00045 [Ancylobacter pratisalsi]
MIARRLERLRIACRRWLGNFQQFAEAMEVDEFEPLERRVRSLEAQIAELRSKKK